MTSIPQHDFNATKLISDCRFCVGDRFYLCDNKILCEYDYEERLVFANMALHPPPTATLAHIKRQVTHLQPQVKKKFASASVNCEIARARRQDKLQVYIVVERARLSTDGHIFVAVTLT